MQEQAKAVKHTSNVRGRHAQKGDRGAQREGSKAVSALSQEEVEERGESSIFKTLKVKKLQKYCEIYKTFEIYLLRDTFVFKNIV